MLGLRGGKQWRTSTKQANLALAQKVAQDWYLTLCGKDAAGTLTTEKTVRVAAEKFTHEYSVITQGERSPKWVQGHQIRLWLHLLPFSGNMGLTEITLSTVLQTAIRHGWLANAPKLTAPYKMQRKIVHRPWFSPEEHKLL